MGRFSSAWARTFWWLLLTFIALLAWPTTAEHKCWIFVNSFQMQQEVENFKKVNMISREQFDTLTPEPPVDPNQEVPPGPPRFQQGRRPHLLQHAGWLFRWISFNSERLARRPTYTIHPTFLYLHLPSLVFPKLMNFWSYCSNCNSRNHNDTLPFVHDSP